MKKRDWILMVARSIAPAVAAAAVLCLALVWLKGPGSDWFWNFWC